jgi:hypothetical protein
MPLTPRKLIVLLIGLGAFGLLGAAMLWATYDDWVRGQMLLTRRRTVPRLITLAADPVEFTLRCTFVGLFASSFASFALIGLLGLLHRLAVLRTRFFSDPFESGIMVKLLLVPLACFIGWFALLAYLPFAYS